MHQRSIVVYDPDPDFFSALSKNDIPYVHFLPAKTHAEAQHFLANKQYRLASICINPGNSASELIPLIRFCHAHRPATPLTLLTDTADSLPADFDLEGLHVQRVLNKPFSPQELASKLIPSTAFELDKAIELAKGDQSAAGETAEQDDEKMHAIEAESFLCGSISYFDVYVKVSAKKYLKILKAKDQFDAERVNTYLRKGVRYFFIKKEAQIFFLQYCDKLTSAIMNRPELSTELKQRHVQNLGKETFELLRSLGLSEASMLSANKFVQFSHRLSKGLNLKTTPNLSPFFDQLKESEHGAGTVLITSLILEAMNFRDEELISTVALGSFLHDIGLYILPDKLGEREYAELSEQEKTLFEKHPILGAQAIEPIPQMNPLVLQIVRQHHERRNRKGYPGKLGPGAIVPVAEIVGIADAFQEILAGNKNIPGFDPLLEMEKSQFNSFSLPVVEAFQKAFQMQKK